MKTGKTTWIYLGMALVVIAAALLAVAQSGLEAEKAALISDLDDATVALRQLDMEGLRAERQDVLASLEDALKELESEQDKYRWPVESLAACETLFDIADECGVSISSDGVRLDEFRSTGTSGSAQEGIPCLALPVTVTVTGEIDDILDFVKRATKEYPFAVLVSVNIIIPAVAEDIEGEEGEEPVAETELTEATVSLVIYTYQDETQGETDGS